MPEQFNTTSLDSMIADTECGGSLTQNRHQQLQKYLSHTDDILYGIESSICLIISAIDNAYGIEVSQDIYDAAKSVQERRQSHGHTKPDRVLGGNIEGNLGECLRLAQLLDDLLNQFTIKM